MLTEQVTAGGVTQRLYYLDGGAIYVKQDGQADQVYYACTDHLGSVVKLVDGNGTEVFAATYDAWGKQTITDSTFAYYRGYTGHEHLPEFDLINMSGRLYDPTLGRFLSCDPFVQMPDFSQNFNRYSYCLNNPLKYNDPSGEFFWIPLIAAITVNGMQQGAEAQMNGKSFLSGAWKGAAVGAASTAIGAGVGALVASAVGSGSGFLGGFLTGFSGGFAGGFASSFGNALIQGANGRSALKSGLTSGLISGGIAGVTTGFQYASTAVEGGGNWLTGKNSISDYNSGISGGTPLTKKAYDQYRANFGSFDDESLIQRSKVELNYSNGDYNASLTSEANYENGYWQDLDGYFGMMDGNIPIQIPGYTKSLGIFRGSEIHISPAVTNNFNIPGQFKAVVGHELIHAIHLNMGLPLGRNSEIIAHKYTIQSYFNAGNSVKALNAYLTAYNLGYVGSAPSVYDISNYMYTNHFSYKLGY